MTIIICKPIPSLVFQHWEGSVTVILWGRLLPHQLGTAGTPSYLPHPHKPLHRCSVRHLGCWGIFLHYSLLSLLPPAQFIPRDLQPPSSFAILFATPSCSGSALLLTRIPTLTLIPTLRSAQLQHWPAWAPLVLLASVLPRCPSRGVFVPAGDGNVYLK